MKIKLNYENYKQVENCIVIDDNNNEVEIGNRKEIFTISTKDKQYSWDFVSFDNGTTIVYTHKGIFCASMLSLEEELEMYIENIGNDLLYTLWDENIKEKIYNKLGITEITKNELLDILRQGFPDIPEDADLEVEESGKVYVFCSNFKAPCWAGTVYINSDATAEIYDLGDETKWVYKE